MSHVSILFGGAASLVLLLGIPGCGGTQVGDNSSPQPKQNSQAEHKPGQNNPEQSKVVQTESQPNVSAQNKPTSPATNSGLGGMPSPANALTQSLGKINRLKIMNDLRQFGFAYLAYVQMHNQGPSGWEAFLEYAAQRNEPTQGYQRIREAGYEVKWNVRFADARAGTSNFVLAKREEGDPKLMLDGSIQP